MHHTGRSVLRLLPSLLLLALLLPLPGCGHVRSSRPVVERTDPELARQLEGVWIVEGGETLAVKCDDRGIVHLGTLRWKDGAFTLESFQATVVRIDGTLYASVRSPEIDDDAHPWVLGRLGLRDRGVDLTFATANEANRIWFRKAVEEGRIKGRIDGSDVLIEGSPADLVPLLEKARENAEAPFVDDAQTAIRVSKGI